MDIIVFNTYVHNERDDEIFFSTVLTLFCTFQIDLCFSYFLCLTFRPHLYVFIYMCKLPLVKCIYGGCIHSLEAIEAAAATEQLFYIFFYIFIHFFQLFLLFLQTFDILLTLFHFSIF